MVELNNTEKAKILVEALPYIQAYNDKILVIKYGGNAMVSEELQSAVMRDIVLLNLIGVKVVLVHGGGPEITETLNKMGKQSKFVNGLRYTDSETAEVAQMVLAGKINKNLVAKLCRLGGKAIGLCGMDANLLKSEKLDESLGYVGKITSVDTTVIKDLLAQDYIPVISTVGSDSEGNSYNINADTAAAEIAGALHAESLVLMTDIKGLLKDKNDENSLIEKVTVSDIPMLIKQGIVSGGMIPKVECCKDAIRRGVNKVFILDGRVMHSIIIEVLSDKGIGTMFIK